MTRIDEAHAGAWCILRTSGGRTLPLARSLADAGLEVWTPIQVRSHRRPRSKVRVDREVPIMPTYVFARASELPELRRSLALPMNPFPPFSVFTYFGRIPLISERDIASLREAEQQDQDRREREARRQFRRIIPIGEGVRIGNGSFSGMSGVVEGGDGKFALVAFGGGLRVKIATFLLESNDVEDGQPITGTAAKAA